MDRIRPAQISTGGHIRPARRTSGVARARVVTAMLAISFAFVVEGQLPPNSHLVQIDTGFLDFDPSINDNRQIAFWGGLPGIGQLYTWRDGQLTQWTNGDVLNVGPVINAQGDISWRKGEFDQNFDVFFLVDNKVQQITFSPETEQSTDLNDNGEMVITRVTSFPQSYNFKEIVLINEPVREKQISYSQPLAFSQCPRINNVGVVVWTEVDRTFGLINATIRVLVWDDGRVFPVTSENGVASGPSGKMGDSHLFRDGRRSMGVRRNR